MTDRLHLEPRHRKVLEALLREHLPDVEVWAYGSRVNGRSHDGSDLDLVLRGPGLKEIPAGNLADFKEALQESNIPFLVEARDWARLPERFHQEIEREHVVLAPLGTTKAARADGVDAQAPPEHSSVLDPARRPEDEKWRHMPFTEAVVVNPSVRLERGTTYPFVDMAAIIAGSRCVRAVVQRAYSGGGSRFQDGDTLMARITPCLENGKIARYGPNRVAERAHGSTEFIVIRGRTSVTDSEYAYYLTRWEGVRSYAVDQMTGTSGRQRVPVNSLGHLSVPVPPLPEQRAIAHVLGALDDKIELNRRMNRTLEAMAQAIFKDWFVDFGPVRAKTEGREPYLPPEIWQLFPNRLVNSELGEIPEGWEVGVLDDVIEIHSGGTPKGSIAEYWDGEIYWYTAKDAPSSPDMFVLETERSITQAGVENSAAKVLSAGTTIITARGTVGRLACLGRPMAMNQSCYGIRGAGGYCDFFTYWLVRMTVEELRNRTHGTVFDTITRQTFALVDLALPPVSAAEAFELWAMPIMKRTLSNLHQSEATGALRDLLLPKLISGQIRLRDSERLVGEIA